MQFNWVTLLAIAPGLGIIAWALGCLRAGKITVTPRGASTQTYEGGAALRISLLLLLLGMVYIAAMLYVLWFLPRG
jgi:hypothetical protein